MAVASSSDTPISLIRTLCVPCHLHLGRKRVQEMNRRGVLMLKPEMQGLEQLRWKWREPLGQIEGQGYFC